jgi:hypothetical protein
MAADNIIVVNAEGIGCTAVRQCQFCAASGSEDCPEFDSYLLVRLPRHHLL